MSNPWVPSSDSHPLVRAIDDGRDAMRSRSYAMQSSLGEDGFPRLISLVEGGAPARSFPTVIHELRSVGTEPPERYYYPMVMPELMAKIDSFFSECGLNTADPRQMRVLGLGMTHLFSLVLFSLKTRYGRCKILFPKIAYHAFIRYAVTWGHDVEFIETDVSSRFLLTPERLEESLKRAGTTPCLLVLGTPTLFGEYYSSTELKGLAAVIQRYETLTFVDEIFRDQVLVGALPPTLASIAGMEDLVITAYGPSKGRGLADLRIGWASAPRSLAERIISLSETTIVYVPTVIQRAALACLSTPPRYFELVNAELIRRRKVLSAWASNEGRAELLLEPRTGANALIRLTRCQGTTTPEGEKIDSDRDIVRYLCKVAGDADRGVLVGPCSSNGVHELTIRIGFADIGNPDAGRALGMWEREVQVGGDGWSWEELSPESQEDYYRALETDLRRGTEAFVEALSRISTRLAQLREGQSSTMALYNANRSFGQEFQDSRISP